MTLHTFKKDNRHPALRVGNRIGSFLDRMHIELPLTNLDEERLFKIAMHSTKLKDFGPDHFREPLHVMLEAAKKECHLTWNGRRTIHSIILGGLRSRLWRQKAITDYPEILEQPVRRPLIIVGAPRTGTTLMNHLLSLDPACRPLLMWESLAPTPWRNKRHVKYDPRYTLCAIGVWLAKRTVPELEIMHDFGHNVPDECHWMLWPSFVWPPAMILPSVREWLRKQPESTYDNMYAEYRQSIQMLHWQRPAKGHWVLKSPLHCWALPSLMKVVPEASIIHTHRNMREVIPSFSSLGALLASGYTDEIEPKEIGPLAMDIAREVVERYTRARETVDQHRVCDVSFATLVRDPVGSVRRIYDKFSYEITPEFESRLVRFAAENGPSSRPKHVYSLEQFNLDGVAIAREFASYHQKYGIEDR